MYFKGVQAELMVVVKGMVNGNMSRYIHETDCWQFVLWEQYWDEQIFPEKGGCHIKPATRLMIKKNLFNMLYLSKLPLSVIKSVTMCCYHEFSHAWGPLNLSN